MLIPRAVQKKIEANRGRQGILRYREGKNMNRIEPANMNTTRIIMKHQYCIISNSRSLGLQPFLGQLLRRSKAKFLGLRLTAEVPGGEEDVEHTDGQGHEGAIQDSKVHLVCDQVSLPAL